MTRDQDTASENGHKSTALVQRKRFTKPPDYEYKNSRTKTRKQPNISVSSVATHPRSDREADCQDEESPLEGFMGKKVKPKQRDERGKCSEEQAVSSTCRARNAAKSVHPQGVHDYAFGQGNVRKSQ
jgi:hypothetical protein